MMPDCEDVIDDTDETPYCFSFESDDYEDGEEDDDDGEADD